MVRTKWQRNWKNWSTWARKGEFTIHTETENQFRRNEKIRILLTFRSNSDSEDDGEQDTADQEYPSLDSVPSDNSLQGQTTFSPRNSEPPSLTESMQLMDEILSDKSMDRISRIDKLEAILSAATLLPNESVRFHLDSLRLPTKFLAINDNLSFQIIPTNDQLFSPVISTESYQPAKIVDSKR